MSVLTFHHHQAPTRVHALPSVSARPNLAPLIIPNGSLVLRLTLRGHAAFDTRFRTHELHAVLSCVEASIGLLPDDRYAVRFHDTLRFQLPTLLDAARDRRDDDPRLVAGAIALWLALYHPRNANILRERLACALADSAEARLSVSSRDHGRFGFNVGPADPGVLEAA